MAKNRKDGFTLLEMLTVVGILGILMSTTFTGLARAQRQARIAKANGEIRQLIGAWLAYEAAHDDWPTSMPKDGDRQPALESTLKELLGGGGKPSYLNAPMRGQPLAFRDPWGQPYALKITPQPDVPDISDAFSAAVTFPNRNRPKAQ